ncbi:MAG: GAF domain-containing protein [Candidatus Obscuribacterales bacterium]
MESEGNAESQAYTPEAQSIIRNVIKKLQNGKDISEVLQETIESLTIALQADSGLVWQIIGDHLEATHEFSIDKSKHFLENRLSPQESTTIVLDFLMRFPDESGSGVISIPDSTQDQNFQKIAPTFALLLSTNDVQSRLLAQLRSRGVFAGFLELQQRGRTHHWNLRDCATIQEVSEFVAVVLQQILDRTKIETDLKDARLLNDVTAHFRCSRGELTREAISKSALLIADDLGFSHAQVYLLDQSGSILRPQVESDDADEIGLNNNEHPMVKAFHSGIAKLHETPPGQSNGHFFQGETAWVSPLISSGKRLGALALWKLRSIDTSLTPRDLDRMVTIASHLSDSIHADYNS